MKRLFNQHPLLIGERINPSGRPDLQAALLSGDFSPIAKEAISQVSEGAGAIDVNVALPGVDEPEMLKRAVIEIQKSVSAPLSIDSANPGALSAALSVCRGRAILNSIPGSKKDMDQLFPLAKQYGVIAICMTIDEGGIPKDAETRLRIAEKLLTSAVSHGLSTEDLLMDCVVLPKAYQPEQAEETLKAVTLIKEKLGLLTILGISNFSYGLPNREEANAAFFRAALFAGLDAAIVNPAQKSVLQCLGMIPKH